MERFKKGFLQKINSYHTKGTFLFSVSILLKCTLACGKLVDSVSSEDWVIHVGYLLIYL